MRPRSTPQNDKTPTPDADGASFAGTAAHISSMIGQSRVELLPFPYFEVEGLFGGTEIPDILANWPDSDDFSPEPGIQGRDWINIIDGHKFILKLRDRSKQRFWEDFVLVYFTPIVASIFRKFEPIFHDRFGPELEGVQILKMTLMETDDQFGGHEIHNHYNHDPHWLFTSLIYLDDGGAQDRGTSLFRFKDDEWLDSDARFMGAQYPYSQPTPDMDQSFKAEFRPNAMLAFMDSGISFHGAPQVPRHGKDKPRKILRTHVSALDADLTRVFGVSPVEFREQFGGPEAAQSLVAGVQRDADVMRNLYRRPREEILSPDKQVGVKQWTIPFSFLSRTRMRMRGRKPGPKHPQFGIPG